MPQKRHTTLLEIAEHTLNSYRKSVQLKTRLYHPIEHVMANPGLEPEYSWIIVELCFWKMTEE